MTAEVHPQLWWYVARASGITAWALSIGAVLVGLALATRALGDQPRPAWLLDLHRFVGGLTLAFVGLHMGALVADTYVHFGVADLLVPLASGWRPVAVAWGVVGMWLLIGVEVSSLAMRRLPRRTWRAVHLGSYAAAASSTAHALTAGTDAANPALPWVAVGSLAATAFFVVYRVLLPRRRRRRQTVQPAGEPARSCRSSPAGSPGVAGERGSEVGQASEVAARTQV